MITPIGHHLRITAIVGEDYNSAVGYQQSALGIGPWLVHCVHSLVYSSRHQP